jgi:isocitrate/isopropylmalate dehydrogenase
MMLEFLGWKTEAGAIRNAVRAALRENWVTPDLGGNKGTVEVGDWLVKFLEKSSHASSSSKT